jgi:1-acyl-sn-glycerol-3-phosphate acyltransferase
LPLLYTIVKRTVANGLVYGWRAHVEGAEHIPRTGGVIFAGNHLSAADQVFLAGSTPRHLTFWVASNFFEGRGLGGWFTRNLLAGLGTIPVERRGGRAVLTAFDGAIPVLIAGDAVVVYPEGSRSRDGRLYRGRTGMARLALAAEVPIIPVGLIGTEKVMPIGRILPKFSRGLVTVRFGRPIETAGYPGDVSSLRGLTDRVMAEIQKLTGQEYCPRYARSASSKQQPSVTS